MKKAILIVGTLLFITILNSCKEELDDRDKFVGTWTGNMCFARSGTEYSTTEIIIKSKTNSAQIVFTNSGRIATVNGNSYVYQDFTATRVISGNYSGIGSIDANIITESGLITSDNSWYQGDLGDWSRHLTRQK
jgi:hypothetical protein